MLSHLLFLLYINSFPDCLSGSYITLFADLYRCINTSFLNSEISTDCFTKTFQEFFKVIIRNFYFLLTQFHLFLQLQRHLPCETRDINYLENTVRHNDFNEHGRNNKLNILL